MSKLLIVEDNQINQAVLIAILESVGISFDTANNGLEAVQAVEQKKYDGILMDVFMPEMNGNEATERIRKIYSAEDLPIIAVTAFKSVIDLCLKSGMNDYIVKPIDRNLLLETLKKYNLL